MAARDAKRQRLANLQANLPYVSHRALAALSERAQREPLPKFNRRDLAESRDAVGEIATPYGMVHQRLSAPGTEAGTAVEVEVQHPFAMFYHLCATTVAFSTLVERTLARCPPTSLNPWNIVLYSDEVLPGNQLAYVQQRKTQAIYWTILEFGPAIWSNEYAWLEVALVPSVQVKTILGGMSGLMLRVGVLFFDDTGHNFSTSGIFLDFKSGRSGRLWAKLGFKMADESALHMVYGCKGAGGLKPCLFCFNCINGDNERGIEDGGDVVLHTSNDVERLQPHTLETYTAIRNRLLSASTTMSNDDFKDLQTNLGWSLLAGSLFLHVAMFSIFNPALHAIYDWMHGVFVNGVFNVHIGAFVRHKSAHNVGYEELHGYADLWKWPHRVGGGTGTGALTGARAKSSKEARHLRCSASEGRSLVAVFRQFAKKGLMRNADPVIHQHGYCLFLLTCVVLCFEMMHMNTVDPRQFQSLVVEYLGLFFELYGGEVMTPKFHWLLHFAAWYSRWGPLPSCWCLERKHKLVKRFADALKPSGLLRPHVTRSVTSFHCSVLTKHPHMFDKEPGLEGTTKACKGSLLLALQRELGCAAFTTSNQARINEYEIVTRGDTVLWKDSGALCAGRVEWHALAVGGNNNLIVTCIMAYACTSRERLSSKWQREAAQHILVATTRILGASIVSRAAGIVTVLHPPSAIDA